MIIRQSYGKKITCKIGGKTYRFKSEMEFMWFVYLDFLKTTKAIKDFKYEPPYFDFPKIRRGITCYTLDAWVLNNDGTEYYQEIKRNNMDGKMVTKFRRMEKYHPDVVIDLVLYSKPKRGKQAHYHDRAKPYVRRIIYAVDIFKQLGGALNFNLPLTNNLL